MVKYFGFINDTKASDSLELDAFISKFPDIPINDILASDKPIYFYEEGPYKLGFILKDKPFEPHFDIESNELLIKMEINDTPVLVEIRRDFTLIIRIYKINGYHVERPYYVHRGSTKIGNRSIGLRKLRSYIQNHYDGVTVLKYKRKKGKG